MFILETGLEQTYYTALGFTGSDKKNIGLLSKDFELSDSNPEFVYAYSFKSNDQDRGGNYVSDEQQKELFVEEMKRMHCEQYRVMFLEKNNYTLSDK